MLGWKREATFQVHDEVREGTDSERTKRRYSTARKRETEENGRGWKRKTGTAGVREGRRGEGREKVKREVKEE